VETVDIELAPPPPKAETLPQEKPPVAEAATSAPVPSPPKEEDGVGIQADAGVVDAMADASIDARVRKKRKPDAGPDASTDAVTDASTDATTDGATDASIPPGDARDASGESDAVPAVALGAGAGDAHLGDGGVVAFDPSAGVGDTPTSAGTAANLIAYFPKGHLVTALIRLDRLRGTRWATPAERLLRPMPDYRSWFGEQDAKLVERFDTLVISSPRPRDPTATTLAARSTMSRPQLRRFFAQQGTTIAWSAVNGGALGVRSGARQLVGDSRQILSPAPSWFFLAPPSDLAGVTVATKGDVDRLVAKAKLPSWLRRVQTIETESGEPWGPALIVTVTATRARWKVPDLGLGVTSIPAPERGTVAMELVKQGWVVRGNVKFATEAEAIEFTASVETVLQRIADSSLFQSMLKRGNALNAVQGLSVKRTGTRVAYATSLSIKDADAFLVLAASSLDQYFRRAQAPTPSAPSASEPATPP
jgi:hypothetical protein